MNFRIICWSSVKNVISILIEIALNLYCFLNISFWLLLGCRNSRLLYINFVSCNFIHSLFSSVQSLSRVWLFVTPWTAACQTSLSITNSRSLPKLVSIVSVMPSNHLIFCRPFLLPPSIFPSIRVFSNKSALHIGWPKYWSFSFNISLSSEHPGLISFRMNCLDLLAVHGTLNTTVQKHQFGDGLNELNSPLLK